MNNLSDSLTLPIPQHYDPDRVGEVYRVPYGELAEAARQWAKTHDIQPAANDRIRISLLLIDVQNTFCIPGFERSRIRRVNADVKPFVGLLCRTAGRHEYRRESGAHGDIAKAGQS